MKFDERPPPHPFTTAEPFAHESATEEPLLEVDDIQGNILGGFKKEFQAVVFIKVADVTAFKAWLSLIRPRVTSSAEVIRHRRFDATNLRAEQAPAATWINIALSFRALRLLTPDADSFADEAFKEGLVRRSPLLGDPVQTEAEGNPCNWVVGGQNNPADVVLIIYTEDFGNLIRETSRIDSSLTTEVYGKPVRAGRAVFTQYACSSLPSGQEHFGFRDEISQPGIRGRLDDGRFLTPRENPDNPNHGKPGQQLVWPGEFVFGYPRQSPSAGVNTPGDATLANVAPAWAKNGSFLVIRRLRQDVYKFHRFLRETARKLGMSPAQVGARLIGRWCSGTPICFAPRSDDAALAEDDKVNNYFLFHGATPVSGGDFEGENCPRSAHIRVVHPRDVESCSGSTFPNSSDTQTHRLLRRGVNYGRPSRSTPEKPVRDAADRGLLFMAYQTSILRQFEFVVRRWANEANFPEPLSGFDPLIGQNNISRDRSRTFIITNAPGGTVTTKQEWVIPTGGGYFFAPSLSALELLSA